MCVLYFRLAAIYPVYGFGDAKLNLLSRLENKIMAVWTLDYPTLRFDLINDCSTGHAPSLGIALNASAYDLNTPGYRWTTPMKMDTESFEPCNAYNL